MRFLLFLFVPFWGLDGARCQAFAVSADGQRVEVGRPALATLEGCEDLLAKCTAKCTPLQLTAGTYLLELSLNGGAVYTTDQQELIVFDARGDQATSSVPSLERSDVQGTTDFVDMGVDSLNSVTLAAEVCPMLSPCRACSARPGTGVLTLC